MVFKKHLWVCVVLFNATGNKALLRLFGPQELHNRSTADYPGSSVQQNKSIYSHHFKNTYCFNTLNTMNQALASFMINSNSVSKAL